MGLLVDIHEVAESAIAGWGLSTQVYNQLIAKLNHNLSTMRSDVLGEIISVAPVKTRRHVIAIIDGDELHSFVFQVGDESSRRIVWRAEHRVTIA
jgi:hypothetical protein